MILLLYFLLGLLLFTFLTRNIESRLRGNYENFCESETETFFLAVCCWPMLVTMLTIELYKVMSTPPKNDDKTWKF